MLREHRLELLQVGTAGQLWLEERGLLDIEPAESAARLQAGKPVSGDGTVAIDLAAATTLWDNLQRLYPHVEYLRVGMERHSAELKGEVPM